MDPRGCDPLLAMLWETFPQYASLNVMNARWEFVCSAVAQDPKVIVPTGNPEVYEQMLAAGSMVLSPPVRGRLTGKLVVFGAHPVRNAQGVLLGAVTAPIELHALATLVTEPLPPANAIVRIVSRDGYIVTSYPDRTAMGERATGDAATSISKAGGTSIEMDSDGVERIYAYAPVEGTAWVASVGLPTASAFAAFRAKRNETAGTLVAMLALTGCLAVFIARRISRPIRELQRDTEALAGGLLSHRSKVATGDEVGQLAIAFNELAKALEARDAEGKSAEQALRDGAHTLRVFADNIPAMTTYWDRDLRCRFANQAFVEFHGLVAANIVDRPFRELSSALAYMEIEGHFARALEGGPVTYEKVRELANGESRHLEIKLIPDLADRGNVLGCFSVTTDITEHKLAEQRMQLAAHHDGLTGLPNRTLFDDRLELTLASARRDSRAFALLYLDLDLFKPVNDLLGHAAGDDVLKEVAARIRNVVRESDTVARVGGDEFAVILPRIAGHEEAQAVALKIVQALAMPFETGNPPQAVRIGSSFGIAIYPADARSAEQLVKAADAAMYRFKQDAARPPAHAA
jgi:diguanylate cyclase (GGDEF)-like protein/PAS domain S-box-containing protein